MNTTRADTSRQELVGADTIECHLLDVLAERKHTVVLKQHDALVGSTARDGSVCLQVRSIRGSIVIERRSLDNVFQQPAYTRIHILQVELSVLHLRHDFLALLSLSRLHEVVASMNLSPRVALTNPVGHHHALIAPIRAQHIGQQVVALLSQRTIHTVVGSHHRPRFSFANSYFKATQVKLT